MCCKAGVSLEEGSVVVGDMWGLLGAGQELLLGEEAGRGEGVGRGRKGMDV
jgi:hypothetical protein